MGPYFTLIMRTDKYISDPKVKKKKKETLQVLGKKKMNECRNVNRERLSGIRKIPGIKKKRLIQSNM